MQNTSRLGIGTVQFGTAYGISNTAGQTERGAVVEILKAARQAGVDLLDTAAGYGEAENVLAQVLPEVPGYAVVTKTMPLGIGLPGVIARARESHRLLGSRPLYGLLVHSAADLKGPHGPELWAALLRLRDEGLFTKVGISAYASDEPLALARQFHPDIMQLPVGVIDQRLARDGILRALKDSGVEIHTRSAFLQGAIFLDPANLPPALRHASAKLSAFQARLRELGLSPLQAGIGYPLSIPEVDRVIVGVTGVDEMRQILEACRTDRADVPWQTLAIDDEVLVDPRRWTERKRPFVLAILQARMSSSRLPGKVLKPILGRPMLGRHVDRLKRCATIDRLVVATSTEPSDDPIEAFCASEGIACFRGALNDVLARFEGAVSANEPVDHVVRLTADCPLADPDIIDRLVRTHLAGECDYMSVTVPPRYPDGLDAEIITRQALARVAAEATEQPDREHVTLFVHRHPEQFRRGTIHTDVDQGHMRWTVDTEADFRMVSAVYGELLPKNEKFGYPEILELLEKRPDIAAINTPPAA